MNLVPTTLPGNVKIDLPEKSYLHDLIKSFKDSAASATASAKSIVADDLKFNDSTAKLAADSSTATSRLATILKAFGSAKLKIAGHTDNVGDPEENKKTSLARANAVKDALVDAGVPADRITTAGQPVRKDRSHPMIPKRGERRTGTLSCQLCRSERSSESARRISGDFADKGGVL